MKDAAASAALVLCVAGCVPGGSGAKTATPPAATSAADPDALCKAGTCVSTASARLVDAVGDCNGYSARIKIGAAFIGVSEPQPCSTIDFTPSVYGDGTNAFLARARATGNWRILDPATQGYQLVRNVGDCNVVHTDVYDAWLAKHYFFSLKQACSAVDLTGSQAGLNVVSYLLKAGADLRQFSGGASFEVTLLDAGPTAYAAQQSHAQSVVANANGYFVAVRHGYDAASDLTTWRLLWSRDGGKSFQVLYQDTTHDNTPVLETDAYSNVYLVRPDEASDSGELLIFNAANLYATAPIRIALPHSRSAKFSAYLDQSRNFLYIGGQLGQFLKVNLSDRTVSEQQVLVAGAHAAPQYPHLTMTPGGTLLLGWTNACGGVLPGVTGQCYLSEHYLGSFDAGDSWSNFSSMLTLPVAADDTGPAAMINSPSDLAHSLNWTSSPWNNWMDSFQFKEGKIHAMYTSTEGTRYVRIQAGVGTELLRYPFSTAQGDKVASTGGFFASLPVDGSPLYALVKTQNNSGYALGAVVSWDNGATWQSYARDGSFTNVYAVDGFRTITADGYVVGAFTDYRADGTNNKLYFFRLKVARKTQGSLAMG